MKLEIGNYEIMKLGNYEINAHVPSGMKREAKSARRGRVN